MNNEFFGYLVLFIGVIIGFLSRGFYDSVRERKRQKKRHHKILKTWGIK